jgi:CheY-like chemotaxis protein
MTAAPAGECIRFTIEDTGIGITAEQQQKIFRPFEQADVSTTRSYGGTGLGLSIVAALVKLMDGKISVQSQPGIGTIFKVDLYLPAVAEAVPAPPPPAAPASFEPLQILVAEDHPVNQLVTARILEKRGHHVTLVADGQSALDALERRAYDLVLMDVQMPVMDGLQATSLIRAKEGAHGTHLPVIAFTALAMPGDQEHLLAAGIDDYVPKPVRADQLFEAMGRVLSGKRPARPVLLSGG